MAVQPRIVVGPVPGPDWVRAAVEAGGGVLVEPEQADAIVWGGPPNDVAGLLALVGAATNARWVALPWAGASTCETCTSWLDSLAGPGLSLPAASIATEPSSATVAASGLATGGSLTSVTVTETVPVSLRGSGEPLVVPLSVAV